MAISLMEAYMIETLKAHPYTYEEVVAKLEVNEIDEFKQDYAYDFSLLEELYKNNKALFEEAFTRRYQVKYVTIKGVTELLRMKFGIEEGSFIEIENGVTNLVADELVEQEMRYVLSTNWKVSRDGEAISILV